MTYITRLGQRKKSHLCAGGCVLTPIMTVLRPIHFVISLCIAFICVEAKSAADQVVLYLMLNGVAPFIAEVVGPEMTLRDISRDDMNTVSRILRKTSRSLNRFNAIEDSLDRMGSSMSERLGLDKALIRTLTYIKASVERDLKQRMAQEPLPYWLTRRITPRLSEALGNRIAVLKHMPSTEELFNENPVELLWAVKRNLRGNDMLDDTT
eukprot:Blabericola_migrator_1__5168@NODE_2664_length_2482_cov_15_684058_g1669_i0_p2_GENE_NODE_2664_length_2482_cov_15_684058_g1669_i0NODE_2664_length_2482_cov_15_684058_g1669_i0_p2_ORF_typecomplete_len209_score37_96_NODE_2664_length_2482_cov_15_684058_g1669_i017002326